MISAAVTSKAAWKMINGQIRLVMTKIDPQTSPTINACWAPAYPWTG